MKTVALTCSVLILRCFQQKIQISPKMVLYKAKASIVATDVAYNINCVINYKFSWWEMYIWIFVIINDSVLGIKENMTAELTWDCLTLAGEGISIWGLHGLHKAE